MRWHVRSGSHKEMTCKVRGSQWDVVYLGWPTAPSYIRPNAGDGGLRGFSQWVQLCTWSPNKLWRSNSTFNLWIRFINLITFPSSGSVPHWFQNGSLPRAVVRIRICFNTDPEPDSAFYPNADQGMDPGFALTLKVECYFSSLFSDCYL
jgi:hypothetical protein